MAHEIGKSMAHIHLQADAIQVALCYNILLSLLEIRRVSSHSFPFNGLSSYQDFNKNPSSVVVQSSSEGIPSEMRTGCRFYCYVLLYKLD